ncbi:NUDIX hydrolase [Aquirufa antheringensis]|jgi:8-oxo-(d)GTP phosphatase|uniref:NUDIX hydrolase n=1 Tax=Aquirufa antheringensis TaxID=2516559 RepID=A0A4Q9BB70_9BACT|nr:NUDIX hydrolase [Aquirufa antheringensis]MCZ2476630.1 NUDIX hydrolase [Aquirufa antheringensis]MCZ2486153.1 NUDIX hydrolase [Aquirufa antheringensis]MCZ2489066.1 NUDIX hydrolase [Aquirufa antheringensis]TBH73067.1 NUDIX hydrolase [Aquirufa antheringensis]USQ02570.1 NUDIX hydrolase [Aquirufa antheringensis]
MVIFIDDRPIRIVKKKELGEMPSKEDFDLVLDARLSPLKVENFSGHTCIINASADQVEKILLNLHAKSGIHFHALYLIVDDRKLFKQKIVKMYQLVEAAGGVVLNQNQDVLWMYRLGKWDLPKGKLEKNEKFETAAVREVEEECNVKAALGLKICTTYHTYTHKNKLVLKKTRWYAMKTNFTGILIPQTEEGIEKVEWLNEKKQIQALTNTYSSIRHVIEKFKKLI